MNLSQVQVDLNIEPAEPDKSPQLRAEETRLVKIIEALGKVRKTEAWSTLKTEVFENLVNVLERELLTESKGESPNPVVLSRIAGKLEWAEKYADLTKLEDSYKVQLKGIRNNLHGKESE